MQVRTARKPGERGTQQLVAKYGQRLVCVRYRYDPAKLKRYKTIELIIAEESWAPPSDHRTDDTPPLAKPRYTPSRYRTHQLLRARSSASDQSDRRRMGTNDEALVPEEYVRKIGLDKRVVR